MKKFAAPITSLVTIAALSATSLAAVPATSFGEATITITKSWDDAGNESNRPESVTVHVGDQAVTLTAAENWTTSVVVDAFAEDGSLKSYAISEEPIDGYSSTIDTEVITMQGFSEENNLEAIRQCNTTTKYFEDRNIAIFKKGKTFVIWTNEAVSAGTEIALIALIEGYAIDDLLDLGTPSFASGNTLFDLSGQNVTITEDGYINFEGKSSWSWFYYGNIALAQNDYPVNVTNTYVPQLVWEQNGSDTGTGYDPNGRITDSNWFMYNTVDVANWETGHSEAFNIQAGQWKNGTNFVGTYTLTKNADGQFTISYAINPDYFADVENPENYKLQFDSYNLWINDTGSFRTSPGNQADLATAVAADKAFTFAGDTLYIYAHFDVTYWNLVPIRN